MMMASSKAKFMVPCLPTGRQVRGGVRQEFTSMSNEQTSMHLRPNPGL